MGLMETSGLSTLTLIATIVHCVAVATAIAAFILAYNASTGKKYKLYGGMAIMALLVACFFSPAVVADLQDEPLAFAGLTRN